MEFLVSGTMENQFKYKLIISLALFQFVFAFTSCDSVHLWPTIAITTEPSGISQAYATLNGKVVIDKFTRAGFDYGTYYRIRE